MIHFGTSNSNVSDEASKVVEGANPVFIGFMGAIVPRRGGTRVEVKHQILLVLFGCVFSEQVVALEQTVVTSPE